MSLTKKQTEQICLLNQYGGTGSQCRYLTFDENDYSKCYCIKHRIIDKNKIDKKIDEFVRECILRGADPLKQNVPVGDNCSGFPLLKNIEQGIK